MDPVAQEVDLLETRIEEDVGVEQRDTQLHNSWVCRGARVES